MSDIMTLNSPADWSVYRLGQLFRERKEKGSDSEFPPLSVTMRGIVPQLDSAAKSDDGDNRKVVRVGDYVINSRSDRKGSGGISDYEGSVSLISIVLQPGEIDSRFAHHLLRSPAFQEEFYRWGHGIVADLWTTRYADMKNIRLRVPDLPTQRAIADFLDRETARIDLLIEKKQRLVALLGEKLNSTITEAVTRGIKPTSEWVSSGEDWIGVIPSHWSVKPLRSFFAFRNEKNDPVKTNTILSLSIARGVSLYNEDDRVGGNKRKDDISAYKIAYEGDIVLNSMNVIVGAVGRSEYFGAISPAYYALYPISDRVYVPFFEKIFLNSGFQKSLLRFGKGILMKISSTGQMNTIRMKISQDDLKSVAFPVPPLEEQHEIASRLEAETSAIALVVAGTERSIELLREYRSALITSAVTGQIDVTEWGKSGATDRQLDAIQEEMEH